jgi:hypothetical protein
VSEHPDELMHAVKEARRELADRIHRYEGARREQVGYERAQREQAAGKLVVCSRCGKLRARVDDSDVCGQCDPRALKCSWCGKTQQQVKRIVAGPGVYICNECIELCNEIMHEELNEPVTTPDVPPDSVTEKPEPTVSLELTRDERFVLRTLVLEQRMELDREVRRLEAVLGKLFPDVPGVKP